MHSESGEFAMLLDEAKREREAEEAILKANVVRAYRWAFHMDERADVERLAEDFVGHAQHIRADVWSYLNRSGYSVSNIAAYPHHPITLLYSYRIGQLSGIQQVATPKVRRALSFARAVMTGKLDVHSPEYYGEITEFYRTAPAPMMAFPASGTPTVAFHAN